MSLLMKGLSSLKTEGLKVTACRVVNYFARRMSTHYENKESRNERIDIKEIGDIGFHSIYQINEILGKTPKAKLLAFHLPQFHRIKENDAWWGEGFTEWTNTRKCKPRFDAHYQPRTPHADIGFYDLSELDALRKQVELARTHGIYGFCFYYYWFSGKRLLEKPLDLLLEHPELDINFCFCWANENWTRTWSGNAKDVLVEQKYSKNDSEHFIEDIVRYFNDSRYIKINGEPVIVVYNAKDIPNVRKVLLTWGDTAKKLGFPGIKIWIVRSFGITAQSLSIEDLIDKEIEFPPHELGSPELSVPNFENMVNGSLWDYSKLVDKILVKRKNEKYNPKLYRTAMLAWDNSSRRVEGYNAFVNFDLRWYYKWLKANVEESMYTFKPSERFTFVNAWNEWAEGTYLEPDEKFGYAALNVTTRAICLEDCFTHLEDNREVMGDVRSAIQVHIHYDDIASEVLLSLRAVRQPFDCFITTTSFEKAVSIFNLFKKGFNYRRLEILVVRNVGRDVAPFLLQLKHRIKHYEYFCHVHAKKSLHSDFGNEWRKELLGQLLNKNEGILELLDSNPNIGLINPTPHPRVKPFLGWAQNLPYANIVARKIGIPEINLPNVVDFPAGNMFWARADAVRQIFEYDWQERDFPEELNQLNETIMHGIERIWPLVCRYNGYDVHTLPSED